MSINSGSKLDLFNIQKYIIIGFVIFMIISLTYATIDGQQQKDELSDMSCEELRQYLIERADGISGFQGMAKQLFKYKCDVIP